MVTLNLWKSFGIVAVLIGVNPVSKPLMARDAQQGRHDTTNSRVSRPTVEDTAKLSERDSLIAHIRSLKQSGLSKDRTPRFLTQLKTNIENNEDVEVIRESVEALGEQLLKLHAEWELVTFPDPETAKQRVELKPFSSSEGLRDLMDACLDIYVTGLKRLSEKKAVFPLVGQVTEKVKSGETLANKLIQSIRNPNLRIRGIILSLLSSEDYSQSTRDLFSQIAAHLSENDPDNNVRNEALRMLVKLGKISEKEKGKVMEALQKGIENPELEDSAIQALSEMGTRAKELAPKVREFFVKRATPRTASNALKFLRRADTSEEAIKIAKDYLHSKDPLSNTEAAFEAYLILARNKKIPPDLPKEVSDLVEKQKTALQARYHAAIDKESPSEIMESINAGADIIDRLNRVSFVAAAQMGDIRLVKLLYDKSTFIAAGNLNAALMDAVKRGHSEVAKFLLENGADPQIDPHIILYFAAASGRIDVLSLLLEKGNYKQPHLSYVLNEVGALGELEAIKFLEKKGAVFSGPALRLAAREGHLDVVKYYVEKGNFSKSDLFLAYELAEGNYRTSVAKFLKEKMTD